MTVEGYGLRGEVHIYGIVDSSPYRRHQLPALPVPLDDLRLPVADRMAELSRRVMRQIGFDGSPSTSSTSGTPSHDAITLLEINPRHSQIHAELFERVDGVANHDHMLQLALGREPRPPHREGPYDVAAKWFVRRTTDGVARRVPTAEEIERVERSHRRLHRRHHGRPWAIACRELHDQDSYSYALANVYLGPGDEDELVRKYEQALARAAVRDRARRPNWMEGA